MCPRCSPNTSFGGTGGKKPGTRGDVASTSAVEHLKRMIVIVDPLARIPSALFVLCGCCVVGLLLREKCNVRSRPLLQKQKNQARLWGSVFACVDMLYPPFPRMRVSPDPPSADLLLPVWFISAWDKRLFVTTAEAYRVGEACPGFIPGSMEDLKGKRVIHIQSYLHHMETNTYE